ncbi:MAG: DUF4190 domain-containing protein [Anaerolineae bacterium]|nr:DUF4190 domain-containing protein [Anaerolineae bacterium]
MKQEFSTQAPTHSLAIVSLVLSILGLIGFLPLVGSIGGIISGRIAQQEIAQNPHLHSGDGMARAGVILGWIGIAIAILGACLAVLIFMLFVPFSFMASSGAM